MPTTTKAASLRFEAMAAEYLERMGSRIREARQAKDLSQPGLARLLPGTVDANQVSRWELGKHRPSDATLEAIAKALDVHVSELLAVPANKTDGTPNPFRPATGGQLEDVVDEFRGHVDEVKEMLAVAAQEREAIIGLLDQQERILDELTRVAAGLPDDDNLRMLNQAAQQLADLAAAGEATRDAQSSEQA